VFEARKELILAISPFFSSNARTGLSNSIIMEDFLIVNDTDTPDSVFNSILDQN